MNTALAAPANPSRFTPAMRRWFIVLLAILPFQLPLLQHLLTGQFATGFMQYDSPYYLANARAIFERGNGFAYPNAYDPDPQAPVIYFHWLLWVLGAGVKFLHFDPGALFAATGVAASLICGALTFRLVELALPDSRGREGCFLLTMWGGGVVVLAAMTSNLAHGAPWTDDLFRFDVGNGWWFPNWGRNLMLPTEAVYHCLVAAAWIGVLQRRWLLAIGAAGALAATHPFSGIQHLSIMGAWCGILALRERTTAAWTRVAILFAMGLSFCAYYFWFLNRFAAHRALTALWTAPSDWYSYPLGCLLLAIGPLAVIAMWRFYREERAPDENAWFWVTAAVISTLWVKHDWFVAPHQPPHFSRGYQWLPLWFLALPQLRHWSQGLSASLSRVAAGAALGLAGLLIVADNTAFIARDLRSDGRDRIQLSGAQREMFAWMDAGNLRGILLCSDTRLSYVSAAYTGVRPYFGHLNNTPDVRARWKQVAAWQRKGESGDWLDAIDYILIERAHYPAKFDPFAWRELHRNSDYVLFGRAPAPAQSATP